MTSLRSRARRLVPSSLTARLTITSLVLVALVTVLIGTATAFALRGYLVQRLDDELRRSNERAVEALGHEFPSEPPRESDQGGPDNPFGEGLLAVVSPKGSYGRAFTQSGQHRLDQDDLDALSDAPTEGEAYSVHLDSYGDYRVLATSVGADTVVTGLPDSAVHATVGRLLVLETVFVLLGVAAAGGAALVLVRRQLEPLHEVADTAHEVAALPLASGDVGVTARVPERLTDEATEVGRVGAALNTLLGHVEASLSARHRSEQQVRQFVADASHELRTPLSTIAGYAELTRRDPDPVTVRQAMSKVETETHRMAALVEDLLLLARLDAGRPLERTEVDLTKMALESVTDARVVSPKHRWGLDLTEEPVVVTGDDRRLHQVLTNLLTNAERHTPRGPSVRVSVQPSPAGAELRVCDDGPGIPAGLQADVFGRFVRGDSARSRESGGTGLGLSLVSAIVAAHHGTVGLESRPGSTCFTIRLPR